MRSRILGPVLAVLVAACASPRPEPSRAQPTPSPSASNALTPDGPPPQLPTNDEMRAMKPTKRAKRAIPDEPPEEPPPAKGGAKPPAHAAVDALLAAIEQAETIEIRDEGKGMGGSHSLSVHLERKGDALAYRADVTASSSSTRSVQKSGTASFGIIRPFLHRLARKRVDKKQGYRTGPDHTDDYPRIDIVLRGRALASPLRLSINDNERHWEANGLFIAPDNAPSEGMSEGRPVPPAIHAYVNRSYQRMLGLLGAYDWLDEVLESR